jgi:hypothetical protein
MIKKCLLVFKCPYYSVVQGDSTMSLYLRLLGTRFTIAFFCFETGPQEPDWDVATGGFKVSTHILQTI